MNILIKPSILLGVLLLSGCAHHSGYYTGHSKNVAFGLSVDSYLPHHRTFYHDYDVYWPDKYHYKAYKPRHKKHNYDKYHHHFDRHDQYTGRQHYSKHKFKKHLRDEYRHKKGRGWKESYRYRPDRSFKHDRHAYRH